MQLTTAAWTPGAPPPHPPLTTTTTQRRPHAASHRHRRHLGIDVQPWGGASFDWTDAAGTPVGGTTAWLIAPQGR